MERTKTTLIEAIKKVDQFPTKKIIIAMEGEKTEAKYFNDNFSNREYNLEFVFLSKNDGGVSPKKLKNRIDNYFSTIKTKTKIKREMDKLDSVWIVCDLDNYLIELKTIQKELKKKNYNIALSNPCFELWLYLHYDNIIIENNNIKFILNETSGILEDCEECNLISNNTDNLKNKVGMKQIYEKMLFCKKEYSKIECFNIDFAVERAEKLYELAADKELLSDRKGTTTVFKLIKNINSFRKCQK